MAQDMNTWIDQLPSIFPQSTLSSGIGNICIAKQVKVNSLEKNLGELASYNAASW